MPCRKCSNNIRKNTIYHSFIYTFQFLNVKDINIYVYIYCYRWYFGAIKRLEAEWLLLQANNSHGSFLIRNHVPKNETEGLNWHTLSIRIDDLIKHYLIKTTNEGHYYITRRKFVDLHQLVQYYSTNQEGLITCLRRSCVRVMFILLLCYNFLIIQLCA